MRLILIRHAQTPDNLMGVLGTTVPGPGLTELGVEQAAALPDTLADETIGAIFVSTMIRTQLTAGPLSESLALPLVIRGGLRELSAGQLEMRGDRPAIDTYISTMVGWVDGDRSVRIPGAESGDEAFERFDQVVQEADSLGHETVVIVSHGAMLRYWIAASADNVSARFIAQNFIHNTGVVIVVGNPRDGWQLESWLGEKKSELSTERRSK
jgi:probable phosphoglycerate mutase